MSVPKEPGGFAGDAEEWDGAAWVPGVPYVRGWEEAVTSGRSPLTARTLAVRDVAAAAMFPLLGRTPAGRARTGLSEGRAGGRGGPGFV